MADKPKKVQSVYVPVDALAAAQAKFVARNPDLGDNPHLTSAVVRAALIAYAAAPAPVAGK